MDRTLGYSTLFLSRFLILKRKKNSKFWDFIAVIYTCQNFIVISSTKVAGESFASFEVYLICHKKKLQQIC